MTVSTLRRVFKLGVAELPDPDSNLPPEEAFRLYAHAYPLAATASLGDPEVVGDALVYPVLRQAVHTKG